MIIIFNISTFFSTSILWQYVLNACHANTAFWMGLKQKRETILTSNKLFHLTEALLKELSKAQKPSRSTDERCAPKALSAMEKNWSTIKPF